MAPPFLQIAHFCVAIRPESWDNYHNRNPPTGASPVTPLRQTIPLAIRGQIYEVDCWYDIREMAVMIEGSSPDLPTLTESEYHQLETQFWREAMAA